MSNVRVHHETLGMQKPERERGLNTELIGC